MRQLTYEDSFIVARRYVLARRPRVRRRLQTEGLRLRERLIAEILEVKAPTFSSAFTAEDTLVDISPVRLSA